MTEIKEHMEIIGADGVHVGPVDKVEDGRIKLTTTNNAKKDPDEWLSGDDPMTGAQASYLKTLCEQAGMPDAFNDNLTKAQASKMIDEMREKANV